MKKLFKFSGIAVISMMILLSVSCKNSVHSEKKDTQQDYGTVCITFGGGTARTVLPSEIAIEKLYYVLTFTQTDGDGNITESQAGSDQRTLEVAVGTWDLLIKGYNSENDSTNASKALVSYSQSGIVVSWGESVTINAKLLPNLDNLTQNGSGTLRYDITFPEETAGVLKVYTYPENTLIGEPHVLSKSKNIDSLELSSGYYNINVSYENQGKIKLWSELAHINDNAITEVVVGANDFTDYLQSPGPVDISLSMDKFTMTDEGEGVFSDVLPIILFATEESTRTISVDGVAVVAWKVGDTILGTGNSITLNASLFPAGIYNLRLVFVKDGKVWQGNLSFEVVGTTLHVTNTSQWENALATIRSEGSNKGHIIVINEEVAVPGITSEITTNTGFGSNNTNVSVLLKGNGKLYLNSQGSIIRLGNGHTLVIDSEDLILEGMTNGQNGSSKDNTKPLIFVQKNGSLVFKAGTITGNTNPNTNYGYGGGGVFVDGDGTFTMTGGTITKNSTGSGWGWGDGVYLWENSSFLMSGGTISENGGQGVVVYGNFTMQGDSSISGHIGSSGVSVAGGTGGTFIMKDNASIHGNTQDANGGGGVEVGRGTFIMEDNASIYDNSATSNGGGVLIFEGKFTMKGNASIHDNSSDYCGGGVGIRGNAILTMEDNSSIWNNTGDTGAGVSIGWETDDTGTLIMRDKASVYTNNSSGFGGGVRITSKGTLTMFDDSSIYGNISDDWGAGGVYVGSNGTFTMKDTSSVYGNTSNASSYGGGVSISGGTFIMQDDTSVHNNTAREGGGVSLGWGTQYQGTFIMSDNASIYGNSTKGSVSTNTGFGGGVNIDSGSFTMTGGIIYGNSSNEMSNTSINDGAALYLSPYGSVICQYGSFDNEVWNSAGDFETTNDTIEVVNGQLK